MQLPTSYQRRFGLVTLSLLLLFHVLRAALPASAKSPAQGPTQTSATTLAVPSGTITLWDETGTPTGFKTNSQNYEPANDVFDDELADDFFVPAGQTWTIQQVNVAGGYFTGNTGPATSVNVTFYFNSSTLPGAAVPGGTFQNIAMVDTAGSFAITLPSSFVVTRAPTGSRSANMNPLPTSMGLERQCFQVAPRGLRNPVGFRDRCTPSW